MNRPSLLAALALTLTCCSSGQGFSIAQAEPLGCDAGAGSDGGGDGHAAVSGDAAAVCGDVPAHADITAHIAGLRDNAGQVFVALFDSAGGFHDNHALRGGTAGISNQSAIFVFHDVPPGSYAVSFFHDANENGELDTNALGIPTEGFGFSLDGKGTFGPPDYDQIRFDHTDATPNQDLVMHANYY